VISNAHVILDPLNFTVVFNPAVNVVKFYYCVSLLLFSVQATW